MVPVAVQLNEVAPVEDAKYTSVFPGQITDGVMVGTSGVPLTLMLENEDPQL